MGSTIRNSLEDGIYGDGVGYPAEVADYDDGVSLVCIPRRHG